MKWYNITGVGYNEIHGIPRVSVWWFDPYQIERDVSFNGDNLNDWLKIRGEQPVNWDTVDLYDESFLKLVANFLNSISDDRMVITVS